MSRWMVLLGRCVGVMLVLSQILVIGAQDSQSWEILTLVNAARAANGVPALAMNNRLVEAAQRHSNDMANGDFLSHTGSDGSQFGERVTDAGYNMTAGAENILYRWDLSASGAFQQWRSSPSHNTNMMNTVYQEVGIAYAVSTTGKYYYTMVLGARADFIPPSPAPPTYTPIPLPMNTPIPSPTDTPFRTETNAAIPMSTNTVPVFPTATLLPSMALTTPIPLSTNTAALWTALPTPTFTVFPVILSSTPVPQALTPTLPQESPTLLVVMPTTTWQSTDVSSTTAPTSPALIQSTSIPLSIPSPSTVSVPFISPTPFYAVLDRSSDPVQPRESLREMISDLLQQRSIVMSPTIPTPSPFPVVTAITPSPTTMLVDLRLEYDGESLALINVSGRPLYIEGLSFASPAGEMAIDEWDTEYLTAPLDYFPDRGCLQVWSLQLGTVLSPPEICQVRHAWIAVGDTQIFWRNTDFFTVSRYGELVTVCPVSAGICEVNLSTRMPVCPTAIPATTVPPGNNISSPSPWPSGGAGDVRLIYSPTSFTVLNNSGGNLDLTGLGFSSATGTMSVDQWNTEYLSRPLYAFPPGDCMQAWPLSLPEQPTKPEECNWRHAWLGLSDLYTFWIGADYFTASRNGVVLETCSVAAGVCDFNLP